MGAIASISRLRDAGIGPWRAAIYADHYAAECVLVGGARRAARMATKHWKDATIFDYIALKRGGFLWSSNNSVTVDQSSVTPARRWPPDWLQAAFRLHRPCRDPPRRRPYHRYRASRLQGPRRAGQGRLLRRHRRTGPDQPGQLTQKNEGLEAYLDGLYAQGSKFSVDKTTLPLMRDLAEVVLGPPVHDDHQSLRRDHAADAWRLLRHRRRRSLPRQGPRRRRGCLPHRDRALIRTNLMDCLYGREVKRTNRIGVGITGFHEWAYSVFGYTWHDLVNEEKSLPLWQTLARFKRAIVDEAESYSRELGVAVPHKHHVQAGRHNI